MVKLSSSRFAAASFLLLLLGCPPTGEPPDGGDDASDGVDAGGDPADSGPTGQNDAGSDLDAGQLFDASVFFEDAGPTDDAGPVDAGDGCPPPEEMLCGQVFDACTCRADNPCLYFNDVFCQPACAAFGTEDPQCAPDAGGLDLPRDYVLTLERFPPLGSAYTYELWAVEGAAYSSVARFQIAPGPPTLTITLQDRPFHAGTDAYVITIEAVGEDDGLPSDTRILAGSVSGDVVTLSTGDDLAIGVDLSSATGGYSLQTPSATESGLNGIWWTDDLTLPSLPSGWVYEGWVVVDGTPHSTGRFTDPAAADADGAGPSAGPGAGLSVPGQDFVDPVLVLVGGIAGISVEPEPDDSAFAYGLIVLSDGTIEDVGVGTAQSATAASVLPSGTLQAIAPGN